jgi:hypothetical protein
VSGGGSLATRVAPLLGIGHGERAGGCHIACPPKPTGPSARCKPGVAWHCRSVMAWSTPPVTDSSFLIAVEEEMDWWWQGLSLATADLAARGLRRDVTISASERRLDGIGILTYLIITCYIILKYLYNQILFRIRG